jgi:homocysteine S-methyltransferase
LWALVEAGVDLLALETIPAQKEAEILVELLKEFPKQKAWLSFSCKVSIAYSSSLQPGVCIPPEVREKILRGM